MWYFLETVINKKETLIDLNGSYDKMTKYFFSDIEDKKYIDNVKFSGVAQKGLTHKLLSQTDYLKNARFGGIPLFSERFMEKTNQYLSDKINFYPCQILLNEESYNFHLCRVKHIMPIIDYEKSGYRMLTDGSKILSEPIIIKEDIDEKLLIVRDSTYKSTFVVSDLFKQIVENEKLKIGFYNTAQTFW
jgi:hypothetical protein